MIIISFRRTRTKFVKFMRCNPIAQLCLHFYVILFGQNRYYLIKIVFSIVHRFSYYFMFVIMEATKLFHWVKAIYLSTIFLLWLIVPLFAYHRRDIVLHPIHHEFIYYNTLYYNMRLYVYYWVLLLVASLYNCSFVIPLLAIYYHLWNVLYYPGHQSNKHHHRPVHYHL